MSLFFDVAWFDNRLASLAMDRADLASVSGIEPSDLERLFSNVCAPSAVELAALAEALRADLIEVSLRSGVAERGGGDSSARIESIEARLDAMDAWLEEFERTARKRA